MDANGNIYEAHGEPVAAEDKARLDGYLRGRAEADALRAEVAGLRAAEARRFKLTAHEQTGSRAFVSPPMEPGEVLHVEALVDERDADA